MRLTKDPYAFAIPEPRIRHIAQQLEHLLSVIQLECDGHPVTVNGFRLRELSQWVGGCPYRLGGPSLVECKDISLPR